MNVKKLSNTAKLPLREHDSAGYDLFSDVDDFTSYPQMVDLIKTGIALEIPKGHVGLITPKSGLGHGEGIVLGNLIGVLDEDFRGEVKVSLWNRNNSGDKPKKIFKGDKIAQMLIVPILTPELVLVEHLSDTSRGEGGFGSTGK